VTGLQKLGARDHVEWSVLPRDRDRTFTLFELLEAARAAPVHTFGWPVGVFMDREEYRPRPRLDGISAEVSWDSRKTYDYWAISTSGDFMTVKTFSEDALGKPDSFFFNTRVVRTAEKLMYIDRLYAALNMPDNLRLTVRLAYEGLSHRELGSAGGLRHVSGGRRTVEDEVQIERFTSLDEIRGDLVGVVKSLCEPVFVLFDFFRIADDIYEDIIVKYQRGEVS
jgi:hypothetical protein